MDERVIEFVRRHSGQDPATVDLSPLVRLAKESVDGARYVLGLAFMQLPAAPHWMKEFGIESSLEWHTTVVQWLQDAARCGYVAAFLGLGRIFYHGLGCPQDYQKALNHFEAIERMGLHTPVLDFYMASCQWELAVTKTERAAATMRLNRAIESGYIFGLIRLASLQWQEGRYIASISTRLKFILLGVAALFGGAAWKLDPPMAVNETFAVDELASRRFMRSNPR